MPAAARAIVAKGLASAVACVAEAVGVPATAAHTFTVSMTSENWDGRFLLVILPFVFICSAVGISKLLKKITA